MMKETPMPCAQLESPDCRDWTRPYCDADLKLMEQAIKDDPGPWTPRVARLIATIRQREKFFSEASIKWHDADFDNPEDGQRVLAFWHGSSCIEGMETLIYHAADAPDSREVWEDVHGEERDPPTHWTLLEGPK